MPKTPYPDYPFNHDYAGAAADTPLPVTPVRPQSLATGPAAPGSAIAAAVMPCTLPLEIPADGVIFDFGEETVGRLVLETEAFGSGQLEMTCGEYFDEARLVYPSPLSWYKDQHDVFELAGGTFTVHSPARRTFRYVRVQAPGSVRILDIRCDTVGYPVSAPGPFTCSDDRLNRIVDISERTTRLCMQAFYEDGLKRDGFLWIGDYRIQYLCNTSLYGDAVLARKSLCMMAASQRTDGALPGNAAWGGGGQHPHNVDTIPVLRSDRPQTWIIVNYCADFLCAVEEYILHTGDASIRDELRPCLLRLFAYLYDKVPLPHLVPRHSMQEDSYITDNGHAASHNGFFSPAWLTASLAEGFRQGAVLAAALGEDSWQVRYESKYRELRSYFKATYVREGQVFDQPFDADAPDTVSWHALTAAISAGMLEPEKWDGYLDRLAKNDAAIRPASGLSLFHVMRGLGDAGRAGLLTDWIKTEYGKVLDAGLTTCPEFIPADIRDLFHHEDRCGSGWQNDQRMASMCHGWTAGPAYLLPRYLSGVAPAAPGYATVRLDPHPVGLDRAAAVIPTPYGDIRTDAEQRKNGTVFTYRLPEGVTAVWDDNGKPGAGSGNVTIIRSL